MSPFPKAMEAFPRLRQSTLANFDRCGLAARMAIQHESGWSSHPAARGTIVHRAFAECFTVMDQQQEGTIEKGVALDLLEQVIRQHDVPLTGDPLDDETVVLRLADIADCRVIVRSFADYRPPGASRWPIEDLAGIEKRLDAVVRYPDPDGVEVPRTVTGKLDLFFIDQAGEHATVWDYKTGWAVPAERADRDTTYDSGNLSEDGYFQQRFYALLIFATYPRIQSVTLREFYPRWASGQGKDRQGRPVNPIREATLYRHALPELEAEFSALVERFDRAYEANVWKPAPGSHCSYCIAPKSCTIFPQARAEGAIETREQAERIAGRMTVLDAIKRQATAELRAWTAVNGDVTIRDEKRPKVYGPVLRQETSRPTQAQIDAALADGRDPRELYVTRDVAKFAVHSPAEVHPHVAAVRAEEEELLARQRAEVAAREAAVR